MTDVHVADDERARFERNGLLRQNARDHLTDGVRQDVLGSPLHQDIDIVVDPSRESRVELDRSR